MKKLIFILFCMGIFYNLYSQNEKTKTIFIYNFTKLINWPISYQSGDFVIGVLGNSPIIIELENMSLTKRAGSQKIVIEKYTNVESIKKCHILFIPETQSSKITTSLIKTTGNNTLIITDTEGGTKKGAAINFVVVDSKQKFELNEANANSKGLKISSDLIKLSIMK